MSVDTTTSLEQLAEVAEWLDRPRICEPVWVECDAKAVWWLILSCGHVWAACDQHRIDQETAIGDAPPERVACPTDGRIVTWRWESIT